jgi:hypothetical protein
MAKANLIAPFPADIDRDSFGHWLSGFADGESSFSLTMQNDHQFTNKPKALFRISLRDDDASVLALVQSFFGCGSFYGHKCSRGVKNGKSVVTLSIQAASDLANIVVPHFERFPLRSKKQRDFRIWRQGVELIYRVKQRKQGSNTRKGTRGGVAGVLLKWTAAEREHFKNLCSAIREQRVYAAQICDVELMPSSLNRVLFD